MEILCTMGEAGCEGVCSDTPSTIQPDPVTHLKNGCEGVDESSLHELADIRVTQPTVRPD